jgi:hypothetical protein
MNVFMLTLLDVFMPLSAAAPNSLTRMATTRAALCAAASAMAMSLLPLPAHASDYYFYVENKSNSRIVKLEVSQDRRDWGFFDIGRGIGTGRSSRLVWDESTHNEECEQWIRARFADGSTSPPAKFDFCQSMDDPIVFE